MKTNAKKLFSHSLVQLRGCRAQLNAVASAAEMAELHPDPGAEEYGEEQRASLETKLRRLYKTLIMLHEELKQKHCLRTFVADFDKISQNLNRVTYYDGDVDCPESEGLYFLGEQIRLLAPLFSTHKEIDVQREVLWTMLQQFGVYVETCNERPKKEKDVQVLMRRVLTLSFPDAYCEPIISKPSKAYKPDFGVPSLEAAIEVKFVKDPSGIGKAIGELHEDMGGYENLDPWSQFYGVIYMTGAFFSQKRLEAEMVGSGIKKNWKVCVVEGPGDK